MAKIYRSKNKTLRRFRNSVGRNPIGGKNFDRENWVREVLRLAAHRYNLDDEDIKRYADSLGGRDA